MFDKYWESLKKDADENLCRFDRLRQRMSEVNAGYTDEEVEEDLQEAQRLVRSRTGRGG